LNIRREPTAVRLEWPDGPYKGREVIYAAGENGGLMHVRTANALLPVPPMAPDSPLVLRSSRHPITEAGFDPILDKMDTALRRQGAGDVSADRFSYAGEEPLPNSQRICDKIVYVTANGETWQVYIDAQSHLPARVQANAQNGDLLEVYDFGVVEIDVPDLLEAAAFNPSLRWGPSRNFLQRLTRSSMEENHGSSSATAN
jgi:hypothetical protein